MSLFAIGDLHLSGGAEKPMDVFGSQWDRHDARIKENWRAVVSSEDIVLIPGDISWAMKLRDAEPDLRTIGSFPGIKLICKGNHDYWWNSVTRVRAALPAGMFAIQHDAVEMGDWVFCGTRGWLIPSETSPLSETDEKLYRREVQRLELALEDARKKAAGRPVVVMMHYPPIHRGAMSSLFSELLEEYGVAAVVYGHLHGQGIHLGFSGEHHGIWYQLVSCDSVAFTPVPVCLGRGEMNHDDPDCGGD